VSGCPETGGGHLVKIQKNWRASGAALLLATAVVAAAPALATSASAESAPVTFKDFVYSASANAEPSQDKPQSKLWYQDSSWWGLMATPTGNGVDIYQLTNHVWHDTGTTVDNRPTSTADALWEGGKLYVASRTSSGALRLYRLSYLPATHTYSMDAHFPVQIATGGSESITVARDSVGRLWTTWTQNSQVFMAYSTTSDTVWSGPTLVPVSDIAISPDDISDIIAFGSTVGIMWSDQASQATRFAFHPASSAPTADWTMQSPLSGTRLADDHINLKSLVADDNGRIYAVVKTSLGDSPTDLPTDPSLIVLTRNADGTFTKATVATVADNLSRPQILLDSTNKDIYVLMTTEGGGTGYYKKAPLSNISFPPGKGTVFMSAPGAVINNISTTKDPVDSTTGIVAIGSASNTRTYYHTEMSLAAAPPTSPPPTSPPPTSPPPTSPPPTSPPPTSPPPTTSPTFVGAAAVSNDGTTTGTTSLLLTYPAGTQAGDVVVTAVTARGAPVVTAPAGWTLVRRDVNSTTAASVVFSHVVSSTESLTASQTITLGSAHSAAATIVTYRGVSTVTPVVVASSGQIATTGTAVTAPTVSTTAANSMVVGFFSLANATTIAPPTGMTERAEVATPTNSSKATLEASDFVAGSAGPTGSEIATAAKSSANIGQLVALSPAG
jgi:hypothetical protein